MPLTLHGNFVEISEHWIFILQIKICYEQCICCFPIMIIGGSIQCKLIVYWAQYNVYFALCAQSLRPARFLGVSLLQCLHM